MAKKLQTLFLLVFTVFSAFSQGIVINEVVTKNSTTLTDISGDTPDWLELYNSGSEAVDLTGYFLSDDPLDKQKWSFKNGVINPESFLVIEASGESSDSVLGLSSSVNDMTSIGWDYKDEDDDTPGTSTINYTVFPDKAFGTIDGNPACGAELFYGAPGDLGYSFVGVFIKYDTWSVTINREGYDSLKVLMYLEEDKEVTLRMSQEGLENWQNYGVTVTGLGDTSWYSIPLTGEGTENLDLSQLIGLQIEGAGAYDVATEFVIFDLLFTTTSLERFATNFKLSSSGETLYLSDPMGELVDVVTIPTLVEDVSYGRESDGSTEWTYFTSPTPGASNSGETVGGICDEEILFSNLSGFYTEEQTLTLSGASEIRYTLDGSNPTLESDLYADPLLLDTSIVVKAACFSNGFEPKEIFTNTYFIGYDSKLPVWSLSTHPGNFFDPDTGMYVLGPDVLPEDPSPYFNANFWKEWEREVHVEFFETDGSKQFGVDCGVKIFGNYSKANPKKSLALNFRSIYGPSKLEHPLFPDHPSITSFDDLILRSGGNDANGLAIRDGFNQTLISEVGDFETQKYRPSVLFINGEYWGVHNIRERSNSDFFQENYNIPKDDIDMLSHYYNTRSGDGADFVQFMNSVRADELSYEQITETIDINSFIDYKAYEIYIANYDWPSNNIKYWRQHSTNGKWRWFMYDTDMSTGIYEADNTTYTFNAFNKATTFEDGDVWPSSDESTLLLRKFLEIPEFKEAFVNRYCDLMNTTLLPSHVMNELQTIVVDKVEEEMIVNQERWGQHPDSWDYNLAVLKEFWNKRPPFARSNMQDEINLDAQTEVTLKVSPEGAGYIKINSLEIEQDSAWSGIYFEGVPVNITAVANPGFTFDSWVSTSGNLDDHTVASLENLLLNQEDEFEAVFTGEAVQQNITISEINYHSPDDLDAEDWVELHNFGSGPVDLSGWILKDSRVYNEFIIPDGTVIDAGEYLVLAENVESFSSVFTERATPIGPLAFSLDNSGEEISLTNNRGVLIQSITYDDDAEAGWDDYADGNGGTLELLDASSLATSESNDWVSACLGGSPFNAYDPECTVDYVGLEEENLAHNYTLSPNPVSGDIHLSEELIENAVSIKIYSLEGRFIANMEPSASIDVSYLENGFYILNAVTTLDEQISIKFIKE